MPLENMNNMLEKALEYHYAVPQFNIWNLEWMSAVLEKCNELKTPVILGVSQNGSKYMGGFLVVVEMVKAFIKTQNITIPVAIHLDHASSFEACKEAIDAGFTSVMIDASKKTLEENLKITKQVVDYAHKYNVSVEAELGRVGGKEDDVIAESYYAIPEECLEMVSKTSIDCLAPALGSVHGFYKGTPKLGFDRMKEIQNLTKVPLVLHGGSGIPNAQLQKAISLGTAKINVNTDCLDAWQKIVKNILETNPNEIDSRKIIGPGKEGIKKVIEEKCSIFGSIGKA